MFADPDGDNDLAGQIATRRVSPMSRLAIARVPSSGHALERAETKAEMKPAAAPVAVPSDRQLHGHLNAAKKAVSDPEKRMHVFKALSALNRRAKANPQAPPASSSGQTGPMGVL